MGAWPWKCEAGGKLAAGRGTIWGGGTRGGKYPGGPPIIPETSNIVHFIIFTVYIMVGYQCNIIIMMHATSAPVIQSICNIL